MKKFFALLLAFSCLFLTACNNNPAVSTTVTGTDTGTSNSQNQGTTDNAEDQDTIIYNRTWSCIDLPSRVVYNSNKVYYYSKADGKAYVYCFDPLCKHTDGFCLAQPSNAELPDWNLQCTFFINNRFYTVTLLGQVVSFSFDGTDKKIEYDAGYDLSMASHLGWSSNTTFYGQYIYIDQRTDEKGNPHTLRFNTETGEMEDLTEKSGNYILPCFFYNGELYGRDENLFWVKSDINLISFEQIEKIPISRYWSGSCFFGPAKDDKWNTVGVEIYDMKTGESMVIPNSAFGVSDGVVVELVCVDENYLYYYHKKQELVGYYPHPKTGELMPKYRINDGKLYRANHDGTNAVCIYDDPDPGYEFLSTEGAYIAVVFDDQILINGQYWSVIDGIATSRSSGLLSGTIGADGKISELKPVEVVE